MGALGVEFIDERFEVEPGDDLAFGRRAELVIDGGNRFMHRIVGTFVHHQGGWWLRNDGTAIELTVVTDDGRQKVIPCGSAEPLVSGAGQVHFTAGVARYELEYRADDVDLPPSASKQAEGETATQTFGVIRLNAEQRLLLGALAEQRLRDPLAPATSLPANLEVAHRLGWSGRKLDRKLDYLCRRLSDAGVPGLRGVKGQEAADRRSRLVDHVLAVDMIDSRDVDALLAHERSMSDGVV